MHGSAGTVRPTLKPPCSELPRRFFSICRNGKAGRGAASSLGHFDQSAPGGRYSCSAGYRSQAARLSATRGRTTGFDYLRAGLSISVIFQRDHGHEAHATGVLPIGATVYAAGRTQIAVEIILWHESRRSASYSRRTRLKMEVEWGRGDKEGIEDQVMSAPGC